MEEEVFSNITTVIAFGGQQKEVQRSVKKSARHSKVRKERNLESAIALRVQQGRLRDRRGHHHHRQAFGG